MTTSHQLESHRQADCVALLALTPGEHGLISDFADAHGFPWEDYADVYDDLRILEGRDEPSFHEVLRVLLGRFIALLREGMASINSPVDLSDMTNLAVWIDRCLAHFLPLDSVLPATA